MEMIWTTIAATAAISIVVRIQQQQRLQFIVIVIIIIIKKRDEKKLHRRQKNAMRINCQCNRNRFEKLLPSSFLHVCVRYTWL